VREKAGVSEVHPEWTGYDCEKTEYRAGGTATKEEGGKKTGGK